MTADNEPLAILTRKLQEHSRLGKDDLAEIARLTPTLRILDANEDIIRQGDRPRVCVVVVAGMVGRYHLLPGGQRQYLSFHLAGDMPDSQGLFIDHLDHAVCGIGQATIATITHVELMSAFRRCPSFAFAIWRETLVDAAIFRETISNNSARPALARLAHLFCEIFYRSCASGLRRKDGCHFPLTLPQLGETLGISLATVNRALAELRRLRLVELRDGMLKVPNWKELARVGEFDHRYLHLRRQPTISP